MEVKCPNCFYETDSWNDFVSINNVLECPECEEHFILEALTLKQNQQDRLNWDNLANSLENKVFRIRDLEKKLATAVEGLKKSRERLGDFQEPWNDREKEVDLILSEALAEIGGEDGK